MLHFDDVRMVERAEGRVLLFQMHDELGLEQRSLVELQDF